MKTQCINFDLLTEYLGGKISIKNREKVEEHLSKCEECLDKFVMMKDFLNDPELTDLSEVSEIKSEFKWKKILKKIKNSIYEWTRELTPPAWTLQTLQAVPVTVTANKVRFRNRPGEKSPVDFVLIKKKMDDLITEIYVERSNESEFNIKIRACKGNVLAKNVTIKMKRENGGPFGRKLKENYALIEDLPFGTYHMTLRQNKLTKGEYNFQINEKGIIGE